MKCENEVLEKLESLVRDNSMLDERIREELQKPVEKRDYRLLRFLDMERRISRHAIDTIEWVIQ